MNSLKSKDKLKEFCNNAHNIFYCCDSLPNESLLNLIKQQIINKTKELSEDKRYYEFSSIFGRKKRLRANFKNNKM